jgi:hypothetical protein
MSKLRIKEKDINFKNLEDACRIVENMNRFTKKLYKKRPTFKSIDFDGRRFVLYAKNAKKVYFVRYIINLCFRKKHTYAEIMNVLNDDLSIISRYIYDIMCSATFTKEKAHNVTENVMHKLTEMLEEKEDFKTYKMENK